MKRKVILMGGSTHVVSLPAEWVRKYNIKKGQEININEEENKLVIDTESNLTKPKSITLDVSEGLEAKLLKSYQLGYDEIKVVGIINVKELQKFVNNRLLGFEITKCEETYCIIKPISEVNPNEVNNMLKRSLLLLSSIENKKDIYKKEIALKLICACKRAVSKKSYGTFHKSLILYHILSLLEESNKKDDLNQAYHTFQKFEANKLNIKDSDFISPLSQQIALLTL